MNKINQKDTQSTLRVTRPVKLLEFLCESFPDRSRKSVKALLEQKQIMIASQIVTWFNYQLEPGMDVMVLKKKASQNTTLRKMNLIYEDEHLMVIEKSAGLLSVASEKETGETAFSILKSHVKKFSNDAQLYVVHRLDRDTSGVMMFAKDKAIQQKLQDNWDAVVTKRIYYAVVEGHVHKAEGKIVSTLKENKSLKMYSSGTAENGQKAVTRYRVLKSNARYSLLEVALETGRKNQIRVHLQDIGHSIAGDKKYGALTNPIRRLGLHAGILEFFHPATGKRMHFETPVPACFEILFG
ncbi:MAG: RNA pseudouridine synthase [Deltaproteobacteria bacterium HGW-Deltaproteobacteria-6]|jgi:23S rRNA pseudouridine1911/1915/1917 synthase|nr:MAG: RNA pseudouridine synthase [Deltaproteobacteria bacterium HGW-Deltaproteobacteria-6]